MSCPLPVFGIDCQKEEKTSIICLEVKHTKIRKIFTYNSGFFQLTYTKPI